MSRRENQTSGDALQRCSNCILPGTFPGITFDMRGVCCYCITPKPAKWRRVGRFGSPKAFAEPYRHPRRRYDCLVALSGGRDSTFAAYYTCREMGLRPLLCTVDNGLLPEQTRSNIRNTQEALGAELRMVTHEQVRRNGRVVIEAWLKRPSPGMVATFCTGCVSECKRALEQTARQHGLPLVVTGVGEPQLSFGDRPMAIPRGSRARWALAAGFAAELTMNPRYLLSPSLQVAFAREAYARFASRNRAEKRGGIRFVSAYDFVQWDEDMVLSTIHEQLGWRNPSHSRTTWRSDCVMHIVKQYTYRELLGFTKDDVLLSGLVRDGDIGRTEALQRAEQAHDIDPSALDGALGAVGVEPERYRQAIHGAVERAR